LQTVGILLCPLTPIQFTVEELGVEQPLLVVGLPTADSLGTLS